jgi:hypothetical protein
LFTNAPSQQPFTEPAQHQKYNKDNNQGTNETQAKEQEYIETEHLIIMN